MIRHKSIWLDIDGCIIKHCGSLSKQGSNNKPELLPGVLDKLDEWDRLGYTIILTTGRRESMREKTKSDLATLGIFYDQLVMNVGRGPRILINDLKPDSLQQMARAINLERNKGIGDINLED